MPASEPRCNFDAITKKESRIPAGAAPNKGIIGMTMTNAERRWLARVMLTISDVAFRESFNAGGSAVRSGAAEDVLRAAQSLIQVTGQPAVGRAARLSQPGHPDK